MCLVWKLFEPMPFYAIISSNIHMLRQKWSLISSLIWFWSKSDSHCLNIQSSKLNFEYWNIVDPIYSPNHVRHVLVTIDGIVNLGFQNP